MIYIRTIIGGIDGFIASDAGSVARRLAVDIVWPLGLYQLDGDGDLDDISTHLVIQARRVDDNGLPISAWYNVIGQIVSDRTVTPKAMSYDCNVPFGYGIRLARPSIV